MNVQSLLVGCVIAFIASPAYAQPGNGTRARMMDNAAVCLDRCDADFAHCLGNDGPRPPPTTQPPPGGDDTVPTPPPYEQCLLARDVCVTQCQLTLAEERARLAKQRDGRP
jgi:hypothetical protein